MSGLIYMLQFDTPLGNDNHRANFYLGYCKAGRLEQRLAEHKSGYGAAITRAATERGIDFKIVLVIKNATRQLERKLKNRKNHKKVLASYLAKGYKGLQ